MALTLETIRAQIRRLTMEAEALEHSATKGIGVAAKVIAQYGLSEADVKKAFGLSKDRSRRRPLAGRSVAPKYRDDDGNTWAGRGRPPRWLVAAERTGRTRDSFLIENKRARKEGD